MNIAQGIIKKVSIIYFKKKNLNLTVSASVYVADKELVLDVNIVLRSAYEMFHGFVDATLGLGQTRRPLGTRAKRLHVALSKRRRRTI